MRKLREVMRLRFELHLGYQQIGRSCAIGVSTVCKYLQRAEAAGVRWPLPEGWDEARLEAALFPKRVAPAALIFSFNASNEPKVWLIASANFPEGWPPAFGPKISQKKL